MTTTFSSQIAPDDTLWTFSTDQIGEMLSLFSNPHEWVRKRVNKVLAEHFVMQFSAFELAEAKGNSFVIQGIDRTALITIRYSPAALAVQLQESGLAQAEALENIDAQPLQIRLRTDFGLAYAHWEWGSDPQVVGLRLLLAASDTSGFFEEMTNMTQEVDAESATQPPTPMPNMRVEFEMPSPLEPIAFVFEGMSTFFESANRGEEGEPPPYEVPSSCSVTIGTFEEVTEPLTVVKPNTVIVKSYMPEPPSS